MFNFLVSQDLYLKFLLDAVLNRFLDEVYSHSKSGEKSLLKAVFF